MPPRSYKTEKISVDDKVTEFDSTGNEESCAGEILRKKAIERNCKLHEILSIFFQGRNIPIWPICLFEQ